MGSTPRISEAYLEPVLEAMLLPVSLPHSGFHTDNGSEFINNTVARLLDKLLIEQTKSRPRQSGDNGLVETKNGAVIRKHIGYGYIDAGHADRINDFYREYLNPYLNYHRPCAQADVEIDEKGRKRIRYKRYQTPLETLLALDKPAQYLRQGLSINALKRIAGALSDTDAARRMQQAKSKLFEKLRLTAVARGPGRREKRGGRKLVVEIESADSHIPSAPATTAKLTQNQTRKEHSPVRLTFAPFRLILQLEKTLL